MNRRRVTKSSLEREALVVIDNYRNCAKDESSLLKQENGELRARLAKYNEIEIKVENMLSRDQQINHELALVRESLHQKIMENEDLRNAREMEKLNKIELQNALKLEIQSLHNQIGWVTNQSHQIEYSYQKMLEEIKYKASQEIQQLRMEFLNVQQQYEGKTERLNEIIKLKSNEIQQKEKQYNSKKLHILQQLQSLETKLHDTMEQNMYLKRELDGVSRRQAEIITENKKMKYQLERAIDQKIQLERESQALIHKLKDDNNKLNFDLNEVDSKKRILQRDCYELQTNLKDVNARYESVSKRLQNLEAEYKNKFTKAEQLETELKILKDKYKFASETNSITLLNLQTESARLKAQNVEYLQKIPELEVENKAKTLEIKDLLYGIERLEQKLLEFQSKSRASETMNYTLQEKLSFLIQQTQSLKFEVKSSRQKLNLKQGHIRELEQLLEKEGVNKQFKQKQIMELRKNAVNPQQLVKKYEQEILRMIKIFEDQKLSMAEKAAQQKNRLKQMYEYQRKDMKDLFDRKLKILQQEIQGHK